MKLTDMEEKCDKLNSIKAQLNDKETESKKLELDEEKAQEDFQVQKRLAEVRGEPIPNEFKLEQLEKVRTEIAQLQKNIADIEKEIFEGMKQLVLDALPQKISDPDTEKKVVINFERGPFAKSVAFIANTLNSNVPLKLDNIVLYPDKITIVNIQDKLEAAEGLKNFVANVKRIAHVALGECDRDVAETAEYFYKGAYRDIWEAIGGKKIASLQELYTKLNVKQEEMQRVRTFFNNTKVVLKERYPFVNIDKGSYGISFFGSLVWTQYQNKYLKEIETPELQTKKENTPQDSAKNEEPKNEKNTLSRFLDDAKVKETLYGKV